MTGKATLADDTRIKDYSKVISLSILNTMEREKEEEKGKRKRKGRGREREEKAKRKRKGRGRERRVQIGTEEGEVVRRERKIFVYTKKKGRE